MLFLFISRSCLLYKHVAMDGFSSALGSQGTLSSHRGRRRRQALVRRLTPHHPDMALFYGRQVGQWTGECVMFYLDRWLLTAAWWWCPQAQLQLSLRVPQSGPYALVLEYASEMSSVQNVNILLSDQPGSGQIPARANVYACAYR